MTDNKTNHNKTAKSPKDAPANAAEEFTEEEIIVTGEEDEAQAGDAAQTERVKETVRVTQAEKVTQAGQAEEVTEAEVVTVTETEADDEGDEDDDDAENGTENKSGDGADEANDDENEEDVDEDEDDEEDDDDEDEDEDAPAARPAQKSKKVVNVAPAKEKPRKSHNGLILVIAVLALICSGTTLALNFSGFFGKVNWASFDAGNGVTFTEGTIAEVANRVSPSVVSILTETRVQSWYGQESSASAAGTGVIVSKDGYIITNKHVISGANKVSVVMDSGMTYDADEVEVVGTDPSNDIAFLKIKGATDMPYATLGDSKNLAVGQQVIAIGNALGMYQNTVTEGIVSGTNRTITASDTSGQNAERLTDMIQTDAAINAGNSGGPLVNAAGQVIGINTAVGSGNNLGFAIPISSIKGMLKTLTETGKLDRAYLGVYYDSLTPQTAKQYNLSVTAGAYVHSSSGSAIIADSPAAKAGILDGDVITRVNGAKVGTAGSLSTLIGEYAPGEKVTLTVVRDGAEKTIEVTLSSYPAQQTQ